jgi:hypothetical protein
MGATAGWALFHISNRKSWELRHAMDMEFATFLHEFKELSINSGKHDRMGFDSRLYFQLNPSKFYHYNILRFFGDFALN